MLRGLTHYWRIHLAVILGGAVATSVLTGALLVGDSVRGSLRELTVDRLGAVTDALVTERFFRASLAAQLASAASTEVVPLMTLRGAAVGASGSRASRVSVIGIGPTFPALFPGNPGLDVLFRERPPEQPFPPAVINEALRAELGLAPGDSLILSFTRFSEVPRDTLLGEKAPEDVLTRFRVAVAGVIPDRGAGRFGLAPSQATPFNAFVNLAQLQRALDREGEIDALLVAAPSGAPGLSDALERALGLDDYGLTVTHGVDHFDVESREMVLRPDLDEIIAKVAADIGAPAMRIQSYVVNSIVAEGRLLPYSTIAAVDALGLGEAFSLVLEDGAPAPALPDDGILLNTWAASDLQVAVGDEVEIEYYVVGPREELTTRTSKLRVAGIVAMKGLGGDRGLVPDYPGIREAADMSAWDPPFPVDLRLVREEDERYWDEHGTTPKAFVSEATGRRLWTTRFGSTNSIRVAASPGRDLAWTEAALRDGLLAGLEPEALGFRFRPVLAEGLEAAAGATDFAMLFIAFSSFLIAASALLIGLLFGLGVEQRAKEIGVLRAVGFRLRFIRARFLAEGGVLAGLGASLGIAGGIGYAWLMMWGLTTVWLPAVGSTALHLFVAPATLVAGGAIAVVVILLSIAGALWRIDKVPVPVLLAGSTRRPERRHRRGLARRVAIVTTLAAGGLVAGALATGRLSSAGIAFGAGTLLLVAGTSFFAAWCRGERRRALRPGPRALIGMAARNSSWSPGRSMLSVAMVGSACFVIVAVAGSKHEFGDELEARDSGVGGFALVAESDVALHQSLNRRQDRWDLGFSEDESSRLDSVEVYPLRVLPGEDASCLNLYRPEKPAVLGVPAELVERGGFRFQDTLGLPPGEDNPWTLLGSSTEPGVVPAIADMNSAQWILHVGLGEDVVIEDDFGEPVRLRLVGVLSNSILRSALLISENDFLEHFPSRTGYAQFLIEAPWDEAPELSQLLESRLAPFGFDVTLSRDRLLAYNAVEHTYLSTFQALGGLGLLLGTVGLGLVLIRNIIERRGELATLRAFGYRRSTLAKLVLAENAFLLVTGMLIGSGSALAAIAPRLTVVQVPWTSLLGTLAIVLVVGMLSSAAAVRGALRVPLLPELKAER